MLSAPHSLVNDRITGGISSQSLCDILSSTNYCTKATVVEALIVVAIAACGVCAILIGFHKTQAALHAVAGALGLVSMAVWLSLQSDLNDARGLYSTLQLDFCEGLVIFCWLVNATAALLSVWGGRASQRVAPVPPVSLVNTSSIV